VRDLAQHSKLPFQVSIAKDWIALIKEANDAVEDIQIFMNGSALEG